MTHENPYQVQKDMNDVEGSPEDHTRTFSQKFWGESHPKELRWWFGPMGMVWSILVLALSLCLWHASLQLKAQNEQDWGPIEFTAEQQLQLEYLETEGAKAALFVDSLLSDNELRATEERLEMQNISFVVLTQHLTVVDAEGRIGEVVTVPEGTSFSVYTVFDGERVQIASDENFFEERPERTEKHTTAI